MTMPSLGQLLERLGLTGFGAGNPLATAAECAGLACAETRPQAPYETGLDAVRLMPARSYQFERGVACGMAMMLASEGKPSSSSIATLMLSTENKP